jgi:hypothetical protein
MFSYFPGPIISTRTRNMVSGKAAARGAHSRSGPPRALSGCASRKWLQPPRSARPRTTLPKPSSMWA